MKLKLEAYGIKEVGSGWNIELVRPDPKHPRTHYICTIKLTANDVESVGGITPIREVTSTISGVDYPVEIEHQCGYLRSVIIKSNHEMKAGDRFTIHLSASLVDGQILQTDIFVTVGA